MTLYHYTCDHGAVGILPDLLVRPLATFYTGPTQTPLPSRLAWFTDLDPPVIEALGLTKELVQCDRTAFRFRAVDERELTPYLRHPLRPKLLLLERRAGALPQHWWVSETPVRVEAAFR